MSSIQMVFGVLRDAFQGFFEDDAPRLSAALAFYALLSFAPLLIVAVGVASLIFTQEAIQQDVLELIANTVGPSGREVGETLFDNAYEAYRPSSGVVASLIGGALLMIGSSGVFTQLNASVAKIWGTEERVRGGILVAVIERLRGIGMVVVVGLLLVASLSATTVITNFQRFLSRTTELNATGLEVVNIAINLLVVAAFFAVTYRALPATDARWRDVWPGALAAAPLFAAGNYALSLYLGTSALGSAYGAAGSVVALLLWVYFASMVFFFGAEVSSEVSKRRQARWERTLPDMEGPDGGRSGGEDRRESEPGDP